MALTSFCGLLTLQVGTAILAVIFLVVAALLSAETIFDYYNDCDDSFPVPIVLVAIFVVLMIISAVVIFFSAYNESRQLCFTSVVLVIILMAYWLVLTCFSFANRPVDLRRVCVHERCGESLWLINLHYRGDWMSKGNDTEEPETMTTNTEKPEENKTDKTDKIHPGRRKRFGMEITPMIKNQLNNITNQMHNSGKQHKDLKFLKSVDDYLNTDDTEEDSDKESTIQHNTTTKYVFGLAMIGAILLFIVNFLFFLFVILIVWSYAQELRWADYYEDPVDAN